jgi:hypothetical protein
VLGVLVGILIALLPWHELLARLAGPLLRYFGHP